ncbi:MAG TPA: endopeptidase La [Longimicrobiales bacterium]|nr:endopeptidase La [Longimicrobiales bacterium]
MTDVQGAGGVGSTELPERIPVIPVNGTVIFPYVVLPLALTDPTLVRQLRDAAGEGGVVALLTLRPGRLPGESAPEDSPFYSVGTLGTILHLLDGGEEASVRALIQGAGRIRVDRLEREGDAWFAGVSRIADEGADGTGVEELRQAVAASFLEVLSRSQGVGPEAREALGQITDAGQLADMAAANLSVGPAEKQSLLEEPNVERRLRRVLELLEREARVREYGDELQSKVKDEVDRSQREFWLREQLKTIRRELGDEEESDVEELRRRLEEAGLPDTAREQAERELRRLQQTQSQAPEYHVVRSYLEWMASLPWSKEEEQPIDIERARGILDRDHYDLRPIKERIVEYLAVRKLNAGRHAPILCLVGPPGVGKTSLGRSIAEALGRRFGRISLGGISDEAEIRGHRRTYVGALPGRIIQAVRRAGVRNPVLLLDEIDKLGKDFRGDPAAALLEVLDPAQNHTFSDNYLEVEFDLSRTVFLATANSTAGIPPALCDRLETLDLPGYTEQEKLEIARRYLIPRQRGEAGLEEGHLRLDDDALRVLVNEYTHEAGVRELERQIARIMRKVALRVVEAGATDPVAIDVENLGDFAGKPRFTEELAGRDDEIGTATALAYTTAGGQILFVEAVGMPGSGEIHLTGHLGDVMRESAKAALSFLRSHAEELRIPPERFRDRDVHIHVPAGATPKDGPSAGVAMAVALASLFTGRAVKCSVAMTGEITLRGHVLPVGGVKEKLLAAARAGVQAVLLPRRNEADLAELPDEVRESLEFLLMDDVSDAFDRVLVERRARERDGSVRLSSRAATAHG